MGGGGGSGWGLADGEREELERYAKESPQNAAADSGRRNVFISFAHQDKPEVELFRGQAKSERGDLIFNDYSLRAPFDNERAEYIRKGIRDRIRPSSAPSTFSPFLPSHRGEVRQTASPLSQSMRTSAPVDRSAAIIVVASCDFMTNGCRTSQCSQC